MDVKVLQELGLGIVVDSYCQEAKTVPTRTIIVKVN